MIDEKASFPFFLGALFILITTTIIFYQVLLSMAIELYREINEVGYIRHEGWFGTVWYSQPEISIKELGKLHINRVIIPTTVFFFGSVTNIRLFFVYLAITKT